MIVIVIHIHFFLLAGVVIGFATDTYSVFEPDGIAMLTASVLNGMLARPVRVSFITNDGTASSTSPEDYIPVSNLVLEFDATTLSSQINISIVNDDILENPEFFYGNLSTSDGAVQLYPAAATVNIVDDDGKYIAYKLRCLNKCSIPACIVNDVS